MLHLSSCRDGNIQKSFTSFYAETSWTYTFNLDGTFEVITGGHMGQVYKNGKYVIIDRTIALFYHEESTFDNEFTDRFYTINSTEIVDKSGKHYWTDYETRVSNWRQIENQNDVIKEYLKQHADYKYYFSKVGFDTMKHVNIIPSGVLKSGSRVLDIHSVVYYHPSLNRDVYPYPLRRYTDALTGEVFLKDKQGALILDTILTLETLE